MKDRFAGGIIGTAVVIMAMVAVFSILGGVGGICIAFRAEAFPPFAKLADYKHIYIPTTLAALLVGFISAGMAYAFLRRERWAWWGSVATVLVGIGSAALRMHYSLQLRGSGAPTNVRLYVSVLALAFLLVMRMPFIWNRLTMDGRGGSSYGLPVGAAMFISGLGIMATPFYAGATHTFGDVNYVELLYSEIMVTGVLFAVIGGALVLLVRTRFTLEALASRVGAALGMGTGANEGRI